MGLFENIKLSISSLLANKLRSILTMLGIIIGINGEEINPQTNNML